MILKANEVNQKDLITIGSHNNQVVYARIRKYGNIVNYDLVKYIPKFGCYKKYSDAPSSIEECKQIFKERVKLNLI